LTPLARQQKGPERLRVGVRGTRNSLCEREIDGSIE